MRRLGHRSRHVEKKNRLRAARTLFCQSTPSRAACARFAVWPGAELHRVRGEVLLERDPANATPAEDALLTAIAVAKRQATRSFELRAALVLAKLYQSTSRPPTPTPSSRPRSTAFRRRPKCRRSPRRRRCLRADASRRGQSASLSAAATDAIAIGLRQCALRGARLRRRWFSPTSSSPVAIRYDRFTSAPAVCGVRML